MGKITIQNYTCKNPITMIGFEAGICWGADTADEKKNYRRGLDCLESGHGRTFEFPDVYLTLEGYSARVIREWYTHIGGQPTRLQASTRYINYEHGFDYVTPASIAERSAAKAVYDELMAEIQKHLARLDELGVPREDSAMGLPLVIRFRIVGKFVIRTGTSCSSSAFAMHPARKDFPVPTSPNRSSPIFFRAASSQCST